MRIGMRFDMRSVIFIAHLSSHIKSRRRWSRGTRIPARRRRSSFNMDEWPHEWLHERPCGPVDIMNLPMIERHMNERIPLGASL